MEIYSTAALNVIEFVSTLGTGQWKKVALTTFVKGVAEFVL